MMTPMHAMLGLVVLAIGILTFVVAFGLTDTKKRLLSYILAGVVTFFGAYFFIKAETRRMKVSNRLEQIRERRNIANEEVSKKPRKTQSKAIAPKAPKRKSKR